MNLTLQPIKKDFITVEQSFLFWLVNNASLNALIGLFGMGSNIVNMIVFHRQQFTSSVNISFFSLALSDFLCLLTLQWFNFCLNPYLDLAGFPVVPTEFQYLTIGGFYHVCFSRVTCWITAYITAERCLSVALPLKVKQIVSLRKTTACMFIIFVMNLMTMLPEYCIVYLDWKFVPERNKTLIGLVYRTFRHNAEGLAYALSTTSGVLSFVAVVILTSFLTMKLAQQSKWHNKTSTNSSQTEARAIRDKKTMKLVVTIATVLIVCYTPGTFTALVTVFEPEFTVGSTYHKTYFAIWSTLFLSSSINSSVNIFLYYNMSTKYRQTFNELFSRFTKTNSSI